ncbi:adenosine kinase [Pseudocyphellaria aurata]|nr:adenosine kinase [Pseudocyphellaria aurata]
MAPSKEYALLCLENPLLDIQGQGDEQLLSKYSLKANDAILAEEKHMDLYEDLLQHHDAKLIAGGAAQNTARGAQYILPSKSVLYIGCVGSDKYASILRSACEAAGLRVEYRVDPEIPTGRCGVIITGHDRSMCTHLAAANEYKIEHLKSAAIWELVEQASVYFVGGYHLTVCVPAILALAEEAATNDKVFVLSLSAPFIPQFFKDQLDQTAPYWDYLIGNETEARAYADSHAIGTQDVGEIARHIADLPKKNQKRKRTVIITQGTDPTVVAVQGEDQLREFPVHDIDKAQICDTNGAGDAFAGGFVAGVVEGRPLDESINQGQWLARLSIQELGPQYPFPKQTFESAKAQSGTTTSA